MPAAVGRLTAHLAQSRADQPMDRLVSLINANVAPPSPVTAGDVFVRSMFVVSDQVNSFGGRFPVDEHDHLCQLLIDSPVMVGHQKDALPIARTFHAEPVQRMGRPWVRSWFYWLRNADGAESLKENIDSGIYKECSIAFTYHVPQCSICNEDIRTCGHEPLAEYELDNHRQTCHFAYREIDKVLETSLVYRGANPDTALTNELAETVVTPTPTETRPVLRPTTQINSLAALHPSRAYIVTPHYDGLWLTVSSDQGKLTLTRRDSDQNLTDNLTAKFAPLDQELLHDVPALLVGYRGKERCPVDALESWLAHRAGPVSRVLLYLYPPAELDLSRYESGGQYDVRMINYREVSVDQVAPAIRSLQTRSGVEIWQRDGRGRLADGWRYRPESAASDLRSFYQLFRSDYSPNAVIRLVHGNLAVSFAINQHSPELLGHGAKFFADPCPEISVALYPEVSAFGPIRHLETKLSSYRFVLGGEIEGAFSLRATKISGEPRWLFGRVSGR